MNIVKSGLKVAVFGASLMCGAVLQQVKAEEVDEEKSEIIQNDNSNNETEPVNDDSKPAGEKVAEGVAGTCNWDIIQDNDDLVLNIHAGELEQSDWDNYRHKITKVVIDPGVVAPENSSSLFSRMSAVKEFKGINTLDTSNVENMGSMFSGCNSITSLDLNSWDTSNVADISYMFQDCHNLTDLKVSQWDLSQIYSIDNIFSYCTSLTSLDLSGWKNKQSMTISSMFFNCSNLQSLDMRNWDTTYFDGEQLPYAFYHAPKLQRLVLGPLFRHPQWMPINEIGYDVKLNDAKPGTISSINNKLVTSPFWRVTSGTDKGSTYSGVGVINANRKETTVYEWDTEETEIKSITRTINIHKPGKNVQKHVQRATITRSKSTNSDGKVEYGDWSNDTWEAYDAPKVTGYTTDKNVISQVNVDENTENQTIDIRYEPVENIRYSLSVNDRYDTENSWYLFVEYDFNDDDFGYDFPSRQIFVAPKGKSIFPKINIPKGYKVSSKLLKEYQYENYINDNDKTILIKLIHDITNSYEYQSKLRLINLHYVDGTVESIPQWVILKRSVKTDEVTGEKTYGKWSNGIFDEYEAVEIPEYGGYRSYISKPTQDVVEEKTVTADDKDEIVDIYYQVDFQW